MSTDGTERRPWWAVALGVGVVLLVIVAVSGALGRPDLPSANAPDQGVDLPDRSEVEQRHESAECEAAECEIWRADLGGGRVLPTARFAVHERGGTLTVVDLDDGSVVWRADLADGSPSEVYADEAVVVVTYAATDEVGARLMVFATDSGQPGLDRRYDDWSTVGDLQRVAGRLSLDATPADGEPISVHATVDLDGGQVTSQRRGPHTLIRWRDGVLVGGADEVTGLAEQQGETVTWSAEGQWTDIDLAAGRVLLRTLSDDLHVHDLATGTRVWSTSGEGVLQAQFIGSWVGLTDEQGMWIHDPVDGTDRVRWQGIPPTARVPHLALERYTVVAWPTEDGVYLGAYDGDGIEVFSRSRPGADAAATWMTFAPVSGRPDMVQVIADAGRRSTWLALPSGEVVREAVDDDPRPWDRDFADGLLWRSRTDELVLEGPAGSLAIEGMTDVVSVDPLIVHGPDGLARLDPAPVLGAG